MSERGWGGELVGAARLGVYVVLFLAAGIVSGLVMAGSWDRMPFLVGNVFLLAPTVRSTPPRRARPLLPLLGRPPVRWWAQSPIVLIPTIVVANAISGALTHGGVEHLWLGLGLNLVLVVTVFLLAMGPTWRPQAKVAADPVSAA